MIDKIDPTAAATAITLGTLGALLGEFSIIAVPAVIGAFVAASRLNEPSRIKTAWFIFRSVAITTFSAGAVAKTLDSGVMGFRIEHSFYGLAFIAFWMAVVGDGWFKVKDAALNRLTRWVRADNRQ